MRPGLHASTRLGQELRTNPRLYQAMDMLHMPLLELQQHLKQELTENPFLELVEEDDEPVSPPDGDADPSLADSPDGDADGDLAEQPRVAEDESRWEEFVLAGEDADGEPMAPEEPSREVPIAALSQGLDGHLRAQVRLLDLSERDLLLADEFIGNITDEGYLAASLDEILSGINEVVRQAAEARDDDRDPPLFSPPEAERMLRVIQGLEPAGVGARTLQDCLALQLHEAGLAGTLAERLVREAFDEVLAHRWVELGRRFGVAPAEVQAAADGLARLNPKPGLAFAARAAEYVIPDLIVEKVEGRYVVFVNDTHLPRLRLSRSYQDVVRDRRQLDGESKEFITTRLSAAQWLIQAIEQRRQTMLKVMHFIVDRQREYFDRGIQALRPLTLREVAEAVGIHESTVSRVTNEKFAQTPRGVLPLRFFFSSALKSADGEDLSARGIKATIEQLIAAEDPHRPLSDQALAEQLERDGVQIARRTVAKYREQLGVLPARLRKRL
ncbi:MAG: RNA polymerase factor sigma-54 [Gemmatimonadota bacterium]